MSPLPWNSNRSAQISIDEALDSLAGIEGYEFLSDLDLGFEEELKQLGVDPSSPTSAAVGSEEKLLMLAARYAAGLPLWHDADNYQQVDTETEKGGVPESADTDSIPHPAIVSACFDDSDFTLEDIALAVGYLAEAYRDSGGGRLAALNGIRFSRHSGEE